MTELEPSSPAGDWTARHCKPCEGGVLPLTDAAVRERLPALPDWEYINGTLVRTFTFKNFHQTMAFVNALAWIAHREDHHPDLQVGYKTCRVCYRTHAVGGLTDNDFICAAKVSALLT